MKVRPPYVFHVTVSSGLSTCCVRHGSRSRLRAQSHTLEGPSSVNQLQHKALYLLVPYVHLHKRFRRAAHLEDIYIHVSHWNISVADCPMVDYPMVGYPIAGYPIAGYPMACHPIVNCTGVSG